jgi:hypothetical protein
MTDIVETVAEGETLPHPLLAVVDRERAQPASLACSENRQHGAGTRRVQQPEHARARAGTAGTRAVTDLQDKRARE